MTRFEQILQEMADFVKWTGATVLSADDPSRMPPQIGFVAFYMKNGQETTRSWSMALPRVRHDLDAMENQELAGFVRRMLQTASGRTKISASVPGQNSDGRPPTFECPKCFSKTWVPGFGADRHPSEECRERLICGVMES